MIIPSKKVAWIEERIVMCKEDPAAIRQHWGLDHPALSMREDVVDLSSAYYFLEHHGERRYAEYVANFRLRNPIMYCLCYHWWFFFSVPKEMRAYFPDMVQYHRRANTVGSAPVWAVFAAYHPVLFFSNCKRFFDFRVDLA